MKKILLGSGGLRTEERKALWRSHVDKLLGEINEVLFIPYALQDYDDYTRIYASYDLHSGRKTRGIHEFENPKQAIMKAEAISVGGGNSFRLLDTIYKHGLIDVIRARVASGVPYLGISAGSNLACPTIMTTNDMPIVMPPSFEALKLIPFQINPHFFAGSFYLENNGAYIQHGGETRETRIKEYHEMNDYPVLGLWEGAILKVDNQTATLYGEGGARLFKKNAQPQDFKDSADLSFLL